MSVRRRRAEHLSRGLRRRRRGTKTVPGSQQDLHVIKREQPGIVSSTEADIRPRIHLQSGIEPRGAKPEKQADSLRRANPQDAATDALSRATYILKQGGVTLIFMFPRPRSPVGSGCWHAFGRILPTPCAHNTLARDASCINPEDADRVTNDNQPMLTLPTSAQATTYPDMNGSQFDVYGILGAPRAIHGSVSVYF
jgi:hypothetical protein